MNKAKQTRQSQQPTEGNTMKITKETATEKAVSDFLKELEIVDSVRFTGATVRDGWECDNWTMHLYHADNVKRVKGAELFSPYYTGLGHRSKQGTPRTPHIAGILHSLLMDASSGEELFSDFCANFGFDTDSRKALAMYLECQETGEKLRKVFSGEALDTLRDMLKDY